MSPEQANPEYESSDGPSQYIQAARVISDVKIILGALRSATSYTIPWSLKIPQFEPHGRAVLSHEPGQLEQERTIRQAILGPSTSTSDFTRFFEETTKDCIRSKGPELRNSYRIDLIEDIGRPSWTRFVSSLLYIRIKSALNTKARFDETELHNSMVSIFRYLYRDDDPMKSIGVKRTALQTHGDLARELAEVCEMLECSSFAHVLLHRDQDIGGSDVMPIHGDEVLRRLFESGNSVEEVTSTTVLLAAAIAVAGSFALSQIIDVLLSEPYCSVHWPTIQHLASDTTQSTDEVLRTYVLEALRLSSATAPFLRISDIFPSISDWRYAQAIKKGDTLLLDIATASRDLARYPDPNRIKLDRPQDSYLPFFDGPRGFLVREIVILGLVAQLRVLAELGNLRKAPDMQGTPQRKTENGIVSFLNEACDEWGPFPTSMKLHIDSST